MSLAVVVDMNLAPEWVGFLAGRGHVAVHWSAAGDPRATDPEIMAWARANAHVVLTHDLDFGAILAQTHAAGPSVVLVRADDPFPAVVGAAVVAALGQCDADLRAGALVVVDPARHRVRILPI